MPGYGLTPAPRRNTWQRWVELVAALIDAERRSDARPVVLFGASLGGVLALHAAATSRDVAGVIATMLLDPRDVASRRVLGPRWAPPGAVEVAARLPRFVGRVQVPIRLAANVRAIANDPRLATLCAADPHGGGSWVSVEFLQTFLNAEPPVAHHRFDVCAVLLVHPQDDRWTPVEHSLRVFDQLPVPKRLVVLEGCGHFPVEEPGVTQLAGAVREFVAAVDS